MTREGPTPYVHCAGKDGMGGCDAKIKDHAWGHIKADDWFFSKQTGNLFCPEHIPDWVPAWRARKKAGCPHYRVRKYDEEDGEVYRCERCQVEMTVSVT